MTALPATPARLVSWWMPSGIDPEDSEEVASSRGKVMTYGLTDEGYATGFGEPSGTRPNTSAAYGPGQVFYYEGEQLPADMFVRFDAYLSAGYAGQPPPAVSLPGGFIL